MNNNEEQYDRKGGTNLYEPHAHLLLHVNIS